jgi:hypothetical protein
MGISDAQRQRVALSIARSTIWNTEELEAMMNTLVLMFLVVVLVGLPVIVTVYRQLRLRFARPVAPRRAPSVPLASPAQFGPRFSWSQAFLDAEERGGRELIRFHSGSSLWDRRW